MANTNDMQLKLSADRRQTVVAKTEMLKKDSEQRVQLYIGVVISN
uniref:Uncharacterized protein n=1 Tax=Anopheles quadriannulatus TaxID=34691 RepID=A0A182XTA0_ANOQN